MVVLVPEWPASFPVDGTERTKKKRKKKGLTPPSRSRPGPRRNQRERFSYSLEQTASRGHEEERRKREMPRWELRFQIGSGGVW